MWRSLVLVRVHNGLMVSVEWRFRLGKLRRERIEKFVRKGNAIVPIENTMLSHIGPSSTSCIST
jgi:hypothetical protein